MANRTLSKRPKRSRVEKLLDEVRRKPSPTCRDPRQLDLMDAIRQRAFADLDREIARRRAGSHD